MSDDNRFLQLSEALRISEHRFRALYDNNANAVLIVDREGIILDANPAAYRIGGRTQDEVIGQHFIAPRNEAHWQRLKGFFDRALAGESVSFDTTSVTRAGASLDLEAMIVPQFTDETVSGAFIVLQDVTARKAAESHAERQAEHIRDLYFIAISGDSESRLHATLAMGARIFNAVTGAIVDTQAAQPALEVRYDSGESSVPDEMLLQTAAIVPETGAAIAESETGFGLPLFVGNEPYGVLVFECANSRNHPLDAADRDLLALMAVLLGSALERRRNRAQLRTLAYFDALTGLPNRVQVQERLREAISNAQANGTHVAVLFFDLDRFKDINDTLGHALGDRLLQLVARRLVDIAGSLGTVARTGGDEFVIVLPNCAEVESIREIAGALLSAVDDPYRLDGFDQFVTTSIGIAVYPEDGRDDLTLIKNADIAMYRAKDHGRNSLYFYNPALVAPIRTRLAQQKQLRAALDSEQFVLHYQPIVDLRTGDLVCVEALVRWNHPQHGLIYPDHFIPSAEAGGLIVPLGTWVLETAAKQVQRWRDRFPPFNLAVNFSAYRFAQPRLPHHVAQALADAGLSPSALEIEITESVAMSDMAAAIEMVAELKRLGARIAVDDFGTGHSSLSYLRRFNVDIIKIDRSFVNGIGTEANDETIVKTLIAMGHSLGLSVVAEGVETAGQYEFLQAQGCDRAQGFHIARPLAPAAFEELLAAGREMLVKPG